MLLLLLHPLATLFFKLWPLTPLPTCKLMLEHSEDGLKIPKILFELTYVATFCLDLSAALRAAAVLLGDAFADVLIFV